MGLGELMYGLQSNQLGDIITKSGKDVENDTNSTYQPQARQQQLPKRYPLNSQVPDLQVIYILTFDNPSLPLYLFPTRCWAIWFLWLQMCYVFA